MYQVSIKNLSKAFGKTSVIKNLSLEIKQGELFFLLGSSGCGKTTLLRILAGFEQADEGSIHFDGIDMGRVAPQKRNTSLVFQSYALWPHLSVEENVAFGLENQHLSRDAIKGSVAEILKLVRMSDYASRLPNQLSGGQQQRIALARALVVKPQLLLLDEPLSNLDARLRAQMRVELQRLHKETGVTTIYVTHDQEEALSLADRIGFMDQGELVQTGSPPQLYNTPATVNTARFLGNANMIPGKLLSRSETLLTVQTALGVFKGLGPADTWPEPGDPVYCFFRPESMRVDNTEENQIHGVVQASLYLGTHEQLYLSQEGISFQALMPAQYSGGSIGQQLAFGVAWADTRILKA